jgi:hypothetical protein
MELRGRDLKKDMLVGNRKGKKFQVLDFQLDKYGYLLKVLLRPLSEEDGDKWLDNTIFKELQFEELKKDN